MNMNEWMEWRRKIINEAMETVLPSSNYHSSIKGLNQIVILVSIREYFIYIVRHYESPMVQLCLHSHDTVIEAWGSILAVDLMWNQQRDKLWKGQSRLDSLWNTH